MHAMAVVGRGGVVGGGSDEWMRELGAHPHLEETGVLGGVRGGHVDAECLGGAVEQHGIPERLRGCGEDEQLGVGGELEQALRVALFDLARHRPVVR
jgi:hypothetical protein